MTKIEALKLARSSLKNCRATGVLDDQTWRHVTLALSWIDKALAQPSNSVEQEPVDLKQLLGDIQLSLLHGDVDCRVATSNALNGLIGWPETQPKREWIGLTDVEWSDLYEAHHVRYNLPKQQESPDEMDYERAIEAKLKEKNHD